MALRLFRVAKVACLAASSLSLLAGAIVLLFFDYEGSPVFARGPKVMGMEFEDVYIKTRDNVKLHGWLIPQPEPQKAPTFICFQGNYGYQGYRLGHAKMLYNLGANVLLVDYRGFGRSEGSPTEEGVYRDADAALDYILDNQLVNNKDIFVLGHSLGGAVAVDLASRRGDQIKGLVLENTFTSLWDAAEDSFPELRPFIKRGYMSNIDKVRNLTVPTLFIRGMKDKSIPPEHTYRLFEACNSPMKRLESMELGSHEDYFDSEQEYMQAIQSFVDAAKAGSSESQAEYTRNDMPADDGVAVINTIKVSAEETDKDAEALWKHLSSAALIMALCMVVHATLAKRQHGKAQWQTVGDSTVPVGQYLDHPSTEYKSRGALRNWRLADDESMIRSYPTSIEVVGAGTATEPVAPEQVHN